MDIEKIKQKAKQEIKKAKNLGELEKISKKYVVKKGEIAEVFKSLKDLAGEEKKKTGQKANQAKQEIQEVLEEKRAKLKEKEIEEKMKEETIDVTRPGERISEGHLHPLTIMSRKVRGIFSSMGFEVVEGPEMEKAWYNFDALNIPKNHPARDLWDTFWIKEGKNKNQKNKAEEERLLLRTHTSPMQVRYMEKRNPPLRTIVPGRVFRHEATDASHEIQFYQVEGLMVDKNISVAHFKSVIGEFLKKFFNKSDIETRLRPSYFPFTEPSFEMDIKCVVCGGKGCNVCKNTGWLEAIPGGMVHPNVLKAAGLNPKNWQGFAFGAGLDRLAMLKYKIDDIRLFYSGDMRFLEQF